MTTSTRPTQHDLAKHLGISQITVSRALSGHAAVTESMRLRVQGAADELGYRPHASAAAMRRGRHNAYGMLVSSDKQGSSFQADTIWFLHDAVARAGRRLVIGRLPPETLSHSTELPNFLREWSVDGLILHYPHPTHNQVMETLERTKLPIVSINSDIPNSIMPDDYGVGTKITKRFLEAGHKKIAYVGPVAGHSSASQRVGGYKSAMEEAGLEPHVINLADWDNRYKRTQSALAILNSPYRPTAIFCYDGWIAVNFLIAAEQLHMHVPQDLSLIAVAQTPFTNIGLDISIEQTPFQQITSIAVDQLMKIENEEELDPVQPVPFLTYAGATLAPPPI